MPVLDPVARGAFLGAVNVVVIALGIAVTQHHHGADAFATLMILGMLPGVIAGALIGGLARRNASYSPAARLLSFLLPACGLVMFLGVAVEMGENVVVACIPTVAAAIALERATRAIPLPVAQCDASLIGRLRLPRLDPYTLGMCLAVVNLLLIALGTHMVGGPEHVAHHPGGLGEDMPYPPHRHPEAPLAIIVFGTLPATILGAWLGGMAHRTRARGAGARFLWIASPAVAFVALTGAMFDLPGLILPACLPTVLCAIALQELTRTRSARVELDASVLLARISAGGR
jgi:peptidoglycan/LPS O-acetylase OafA/YrhL